MDEGISYNREGLKKLQKAIANADDADWEMIGNAEIFAKNAKASADASKVSEKAADDSATTASMRVDEARGFSEVAASYSSEALEYANRAESAAETAATNAAEEARAGVEAIATEAAQAVIDNKQDKLTAGANITIDGNVISATGGGGGGTSDYSELTNKPQIAGVELSGNKSLNDLGIASASALSTLASKVDTANTTLEGVL